MTAPSFWLWPQSSVRMSEKGQNHSFRKHWPTYTQKVVHTYHDITTCCNEIKDQKTGQFHIVVFHYRGGWFSSLFFFWINWALNFQAFSTKICLHLDFQKNPYEYSPSRCTLAKATDQHHERVSASFGPSALKVRSFWMDYTSTKYPDSLGHKVKYCIILCKWTSITQM